MTVAPWPSTGTDSTCRYCGTYVTQRFARVYGDNCDRVHRCHDCDSYRRLTRGSAVGRDVPVPDPETTPGHHGGAADV